MSEIDTGLYLTGGTAASRAYLHHRFSDDLDFFTNDNPEFELWAGRFTQALQDREEWSTTVVQRDRRFVRLNLIRNDVLLKIEMVNDVPARVGEIRCHEILGWIDTPENILANKITAAVDREEPKDFADIWGFCYRLGLPLLPAIEGAQSKAAGIFPADLARLLCSVRRKDWELVRWIEAPDPDRFVSDLARLGEGLVLV
ncbi:MAG TPA: nucleotidyl transferase AbiEii/AbiGii toxin family protein [Thermoanaerobaculia bacterium]|nr:nucleotidyl transferase AbiEii/AbiGii toxin family protein [Thermoanaerobaculia bacterium]